MERRRLLVALLALPHAFSCSTPDCATCEASVCVACNEEYFLDGGACTLANTQLTFPTLPSYPGWYVPVADGYLAYSQYTEPTLGGAGWNARIITIPTGIDASIALAQDRVRISNAAATNRFFLLGRFIEDTSTIGSADTLYAAALTGSSVVWAIVGNVGANPSLPVYAAHLTNIFVSDGAFADSTPCSACVFRTIGAGGSITNYVYGAAAQTVSVSAASDYSGAWSGADLLNVCGTTLFWTATNRATGLQAVHSADLKAGPTIASPSITLHAPTSTVSGIKDLSCWGADLRFLAADAISGVVSIYSLPAGSTPSVLVAPSAATLSDFDEAGSAGDVGGVYCVTATDSNAIRRVACLGFPGSPSVLTAIPSETLPRTGLNTILLVSSDFVRFNCLDGGGVSRFCSYDIANAVLSRDDSITLPYGGFIYMNDAAGTAKYAMFAAESDTIPISLWAKRVA